MSDNILTSAELDVIEQRVKGATPGPWAGPPKVLSLANLKFIAHSRTDMSRLIATVRALQTGVVDEREACAKIADEWQNSDADMSEKLAARIIADLIRQRGEQ